MSNIPQDVHSLRRYFQTSSLSQDIKKADLLSSSEALKSFGRLWGKHPEDVMMMLAVLQHQFTETSFTQDQLNAVKSVLGNMAVFLRECSAEWDEHEYKQQMKQAKSQ